MKKSRKTIRTNTSFTLTAKNKSIQRMIEDRETAETKNFKKRKEKKYA
jgi:hypothetical protein